MRNLFALMFAAILAGCGGGGSSGGGCISCSTGLNIPVGTVSGSSFDGLLSNATISAYDYSTGAKGALLASTTSNSSGSYTLSLQVESRPLLLEATGGTYVEEAGSNTSITLNSGQALRAVANYAAGAIASVSVTTYTHLAAGLAAYQISKGTAVAAAIDNANSRVTGLAGVDILATTPKEITDISNASATLTPSLQYGFLEAAVSKWTYDHVPTNGATAHILPYTSIDFAQLMYRDVSSDGLLDGKGLDNAGAVTSLSFGATALGVDVYRFGIGAAILQMTNDANNKTGITTAKALSYANSYIGSTDAMFNGIAPLAFVAPGVVITSPSAASVVNGTLNVSATTTTDVGVASVTLLVDGSAKATAASVTAPVFSLATSAYADGVHTLFVTAVDLAGLSTTTPVAVTINNTSPGIVITAPTAGNAAGTVSVSAAVNSVVTISKVELLVDGVVKATAASVTAPAFSLDTTTYSDGAHTVSVRATSVGALVTESSVFLTFLNNPPVASVTTPVANSWARKTITITGTATSANTLSSVTLLVDGVASGTAVSLNAPSVTLNTGSYTDGAHTVAFKAVDNLGLTTTSAAVPIKIDNTPPTTTGMYVAMTASNKFTRTDEGTATDNYSGFASVTLLATGVVYSPVTLSNSTVNWEIPIFNANTAAAATVWSNIRIMDNAGNCSDYGFNSGAPSSTSMYLVALGSCP